jgi:methyl-accepting chemotaxis protein
MLTVKSGTDTADEIGGLAGDLPTDARLRDLERALRGLVSTPPDAERARKWAAVDLFAAFLSEEPAALETGRSARFWQAVDTAVQVLVFVPIALTWLGLTMAASAYRAAEANGSLGGESFLQGWQTGFRGQLPGWVTFDHVALYTFCIVSVLIVGTAALVVHRKQLDEGQAELRRRLAAALTRADLELAPFRLGLSERVAKELDMAADKLRGTVGAIDTAGRVAARSQQKAADALTAVVPALASVETAATAASTAASALERAPDRFGGHLDQMTQATGDVTAAQRQLVSAAGDASRKIADALQDGAGQVRASLTDVSATANNYTGRLEQAADILGQAHGAIGALPAAVSGLRGDVASMHAEVAEFGSRISDLTAAIATAKAAVPEPGEWSAPLRAVADDLRKSAEDLRTAAVALQRSLELQSLEKQEAGSLPGDGPPAGREDLDGAQLDGQSASKDPLDREPRLYLQRNKARSAPRRDR